MQSGWGLASCGIGNTKYRDVSAVDVRAGMPGLGRTAWDAVGLFSTNRNRVKVARTSVENDLLSLCSETEPEF